MAGASLALFLIVPIFINAGWADVGSVKFDGAGEDRKPPVQAGPFPDTVESGIWKLNHEYTYRWVNERDPVGETSLKILRHQVGSAAVGYELRSQLQYERDGRTLRISRRYEFDAEWSLERYSGESRLRAVNDARSKTTARGWVDENRLFVEVVHNRTEKEDVYELPFPDGAYLLLAQGVELWAVYAPHLRSLKLPAAIKMAYPDFGSLYEVTLRSRGKDTVPHGKEIVECTHFHFKSKNRQLEGELWIDASGRLLLYRQGQLTIRLEPEPEGPTHQTNKETDKTKKSLLLLPILPLLLFVFHWCRFVGSSSPLLYASSVVRQVTITL